MKPLILYFVLAYVISWLIWLPLYGPHFGVQGLPLLPFHHGLGGLGPLVSAFITTYVFQKKAGVRQLLLKCVQLKPFVYLIIAFFSPFVLAVIAAVGSYFLYQTPLNLTTLIRSHEFPDFNIVAVFGYNILFFGLGEEAGWRGFALPRFQQRFNALTSSLLLTLFLGRLALACFFLSPGYLSMDLGGIAGWVFSLLTGSVLLTWLYNSSRGSILICAVFHATIDMAFTAENTRPETTALLGMLITVWGILTILIFRPKQLSTA